MYYNTKESGERIHQLRIKAGYTQEKIAQTLNIDRSFYSRIESGKNGCSVDLLAQLSELFGVSLDYLILGKYTQTMTGTAERALLKEDVEALAAHLTRFGTNL